MSLWNRVAGRCDSEWRAALRPRVNEPLVEQAWVDEEVVDLVGRGLLARLDAEADGDLAPARLLAEPLRLELDVVAQRPAVLRLEPELLGLPHVVLRERGIDDVDGELRVRVLLELGCEEPERRVVEV